ncbi:hypothetical protein CPB84DRAFT_1780854 [Gymnopilus junonius]|uniref:Secreted protein n=1 Tax=Gymnopilus junonius TaxID=109634 RepID=A0A9P5NMC3_GYMJU|nr:hypothetical protein CPB84DRAFT_1780854 [Gymnopilus junonius]
MPPQLLVATVITPAILFCLQAMTPSEEIEEGKDLVVDHEEEADDGIAAIEEGDDEASEEIQEDERRQIGGC